MHINEKQIISRIELTLFFHFFLDEFSSQDEDDKDSIQMPNQRDANGIPKIISRCKAIYSYTPKLADELRINPGMQITAVAFCLGVSGVVLSGFNDTKY